MNGQEVLKKISSKTNLSQSSVRGVLEELKNLVVEVVNKGGEVRINGVGKFFAVETKSRIFCNPVTKRKFYSQPKKQIKFVISKKFKFSIK